MITNFKLDTWMQQHLWKESDISFMYVNDKTYSQTVRPKGFTRNLNLLKSGKLSVLYDSVHISHTAIPTERAEFHASDGKIYILIRGYKRASK